jgi:predicted YcjX-like family ATPase
LGLYHLEILGVALYLRTSEHRVGVIGLYASGKTVFLTSLINHLKDQLPDRFELGTPAQPVAISRFTVLDSDPGWPAFNYAQYRDTLAKRHRWPKKTTDRSQFVCRFQRSDWYFTDVLLKLYDLPGERIADAIMYAKDYAGWSDHMLKLLRENSDYTKHAGEFLALQSQTGITEAQLIHAYKLALARLIHDYKPYISPSTFLTDTQGSNAPNVGPIQLAEQRICGLDAGSQFVPMSPTLRQENPGLTQTFTQRYAQYRQQVVCPTIETLATCNALIVLVDVTMLLSGGEGMYNDNRQILQDIIEVLDPGESIIGKLLRNTLYQLLPSGWRPGWITKIAFVAPKLDCVAPQDRDKLISLLRRMVHRHTERFDGVQVRYFNCAAALSTRVFDDRSRTLLGLPMYDETGAGIQPAEERKLVVSEVPSDWPASWSPGQYRFADVYPRLPPRKDLAPEQVNLDRILQFILE